MLAIFYLFFLAFFFATGNPPFAQSVTMLARAAALVIARRSLTQHAGAH